MTDTEPQQNDFLPPPLRRALPYFLLGFAAFCAYINSFNNLFVFDDDLLIGLNTNLHDWGHVWDIVTGSTTSGAHIPGGFYRPLQMLLYLFVYQIFGPHEWGFHLLDFSLHAANTCLMYRLGAKLGFRPGGVFLAALVWALHPLFVEAVSYISGTADPLFVFFALLALVLLLPNITQAGIYKIIPLFLLGLAGKETMVVFPALAMICIFATNPARRDWRTYLRTWPLWLIALAYAAWRCTASGFDGPQTYSRFYSLPSYAMLGVYAAHLSDRLYTFFATLPNYAELLLWPHGLHMERAFPIATTFFLAPVMIGFAFCALALLRIVHGFAREKDRPLAFGLLWFFAAHGPDSGILVPMNSLFLEHWMYLPTIGLFLGLGETAARLLDNRPRARIAAVAATLAFAAAMGALTAAQNEIWRTPETFYKNIFRYGEASARAHNNLGLYYSGIGRLDDAAAQLREAIRLSDSYAETRHNLALVLLRMPDQKAYLPEAIADLRRALEIDPNFYRSDETLAEIYAQEGDPAQARLYRERAVQALSRLRAAAPP